MSANATQIVPVSDRSGERVFLQLPYRLYRDDPNWVAPLRREERRRWSPRHNSALRSRRTARFLALRGTRAVGRIAAVVDPAFVARWDNAGFFGFFECEADPEAATGLLRAAEDFIIREGAGTALGPVNLSTHDEIGLLVAGHDSPPMILSPYNHPYYQTLIEQAGYTPARDYHAFLWTPAARPAPVLDRLVRRTAGQGPGAPRLRHLDPTRWDADVRAIFGLYNDTFADLWGFVPISWEEFRARAAEFRAFYRPELVIIAELAGEAVGFGLLLPDINAALKPIKGRLFPFGLLRLMRSVPRLSTGRFILLGVRRGHSGRGLAALIAQTMVEAVRQVGYQAVELSLVQEGNEAVRHVIAAFGAPPAKTYRLYQKPLR